MNISLQERANSIWHTQRVKRLVRDHLGNGAQCLVSVRETVCSDPGCEGPATEIRIVTLGFREIKALVHKQPSQIVASDVAAIL
ncbi:MAG: hypothetical protein AAFQ58_02435 [Pseudomonadota bacterium]